MLSENYDTIIVHDGVFHADDVMCVAIMRYINPDIKVERTRKMPKNKPDHILFADIGSGKYDHHKKEVPLRKDGNKHASCGLLLEDFWPEIFPAEEDYQNFNKWYIIPIENQDNGLCGNPLSRYISSFIPVWDSVESMDTAFDNAVNVFMDLIRRNVEMANARLRAEAYVQKAFDESNGVYVVLDAYMDYARVLEPSSALYVIYPYKGKNWHLQCLSRDKAYDSIKRHLPKSWLKHKPEGCTFVHAKLFVATFDTKENAVNAVQSLG